MEKDKSGNLIFDRKSGDDERRINLILTALGHPEAATVGRTEPAPSLRVKAMIEAGLISDASDLLAENFSTLSKDFSTLTERAARCNRGAYAVQTLVVREDEISGLYEKLRQPLDWQHGPDYSLEYVKDEVSEQAEKLVEEMENLQPGESTRDF